MLIAPTIPPQLVSASAAARLRQFLTVPSVLRVPSAEMSLSTSISDAVTPPPIASTAKSTRAKKSSDTACMSPLSRLSPNSSATERKPVKDSPSAENSVLRASSSLLTGLKLIASYRDKVSTADVNSSSALARQSRADPTPSAVCDSRLSASAAGPAASGSLFSASRAATAASRALVSSVRITPSFCTTVLSSVPTAVISGAFMNADTLCFISFTAAMALAMAVFAASTSPHTSL